MADVLKIRAESETKWDCVAFGEIMLRFDPGFGRPNPIPLGLDGTRKRPSRTKRKESVLNQNSI